MSTPHSQWQRLLTDQGQEAVVNVAVNQTAPNPTDKVGVLCANRRKLTIRTFNTAAVGSFDVEVFLQYAVDEPWFSRIASVNVATSNFSTIEATGAIRAFALVDNFAGGAVANVRISGGD